MNKLQKKIMLIGYYVLLGTAAVYIIWSQTPNSAAFSVLFIVVFLLCLIPLFALGKLRRGGASSMDL